MPNPQLHLPLFYQAGLEDLFNKKNIKGSKLNLDTNQKDPINVAGNLGKLGQDDPGSDALQAKKINYLVSQGVDIAAEIKSSASSIYKTQVEWQAAYLKNISSTSLSTIANVDPGLGRAYNETVAAIKADTNVKATQDQMSNATEKSINVFLQKITQTGIKSLTTAVSKVDNSTLLPQLRNSLDQPSFDLKQLKNELNKAGLTYDHFEWQKIIAKNKQKTLEDKVLMDYLEHCRELSKQELEKTAATMLADANFMEEFIKKNADVHTLIKSIETAPLDATIATRAFNTMMTAYGDYLSALANDPNLAKSPRFEKDFKDAQHALEQNIASRQALQAYQQSSAKYRDANCIQITKESNTESLPDFNDSEARVFIVPGSHPSLSATYKNGVWTILNDTIAEQGFLKKGGMAIKDTVMTRLFDKPPAHDPTFDKLKELGLTRAQILSLYIGKWQNEVIDAGKNDSEPLQIVGDSSQKVIAEVAQGLIANGKQLVPGLQDRVSQLDSSFQENLAKTQQGLAAIKTHYESNAKAEIENQRNASQREREAQLEIAKKDGVEEIRKNVKHLKEKINDLLPKTKKVVEVFKTLKEGMKAAKNAKDNYDDYYTSASDLGKKILAPIYKQATLLGATVVNVDGNARSIPQNFFPDEDQKDYSYSAKLIQEQEAQLNKAWGECNQSLIELKQKRDTLISQSALSPNEAESLNKLITKMENSVSHFLITNPKNPLSEISNDLKSFDFENYQKATSADDKKAMMPDWWFDPNSTTRLSKSRPADGSFSSATDSIDEEESFTEEENSDKDNTASGLHGLL